MQIKSLRTRSYRSFKVDDTTPADAIERLRRIETCRRLRAEGCSEATALRAVGWPRSTCFRWLKRYRSHGVGWLAARSRRPRHVQRPRWTRAEERRVWAMRTRYPFMGKRRPRVMLRREGLQLSESSVGRILAKGLRLGRVQPCALCRGRLKAKRRRRFDGHAQRWRHGQRAARPGELVQIDHMSLRRDGKRLKEFKAVSPVGKQLVARAYTRATARNAKRFLEAVQADLPHPLLSIQVDGGSEFMAEFEQACQELGIPLYVLPPRRPQFNGCVERANDTTRVEFWNLYQGRFTAADANRALADYQRFHNHVRPHFRASRPRTPQHQQQDFDEEREDKDGSIWQHVMNSRFHLKSAANLSKDWSPPLSGDRPACFWWLSDQERFFRRSVAVLPES